MARWIDMTDAARGRIEAKANAKRAAEYPARVAMAQEDVAAAKRRLAAQPTSLMLATSLRDAEARLATALEDR